MILFIIGNGFDIGHGMNTSYKQFYHFLKDRHNDFFHSIASLFIAEQETDRLWSEFEERLASFNPSYFIDNKLTPERTSETVLDFQEALSLYFKEWVAGIALPQVNTSISFIPNSFFINFNYTDTLEQLYNIPYDKILHIHGQANNPKSRIIIGHGSETTIDAMCESYGIVKNRSIECTVEELNYLLATEMLLFTLRKPTEKIIQKELEPLSYKDVSEIIVLGHSLGKVDWPYLKYIKERSPQTTHWSFSAYCDRDKKQINRFTKAIKINGYSIDTLQNLITEYSEG